MAFEPISGIVRGSQLHRHTFAGTETLPMVGASCIMTSSIVDLFHERRRSGRALPSVRLSGGTLGNPTMTIGVDA
jgi:hypothetical protein